MLNGAIYKQLISYLDASIIYLSIYLHSYHHTFIYNYDSLFHLSVNSLKRINTHYSSPYSSQYLVNYYGCNLFSLNFSLKNPSHSGTQSHLRYHVHFRDLKDVSQCTRLLDTGRGLTSDGQSTNARSGPLLQLGCFCYTIFLLQCSPLSHCIPVKTII